MRSSEETAVTPDSESVDAIITTMPYLCLKERRHRKMMHGCWFFTRICSPLTPCTSALPFNSAFCSLLPLHHLFIFLPTLSWLLLARRRRPVVPTGPRESLKFPWNWNVVVSCPALDRLGLKISLLLSLFALKSCVFSLVLLLHTHSTYAP